jgi:superfamily II DNA or RNA helicase
MFDLNKFKNLGAQKRYDRQLIRMFSQGSEKERVEKAAQEAITNIGNGKKSFVIYGEPQSGKTEMMIALTARLLDEGHSIVVVLLNDNVQLLQQNLDRFRGSSIDPTPMDIADILEENIDDKTWIIFCKKNTHDLKRLYDKLYNKSEKVIIDDEADFASPNAKINRAERTAINHAIYNLLGKKGIYIGVTATPARLDMNNTFDNMTEDWIIFPPHKDYVGKDVFFPLDFSKPRFSLNFLPATGDDPTHLREAILNFLVNVAYINLFDEKVKN